MTPLIACAHGTRSEKGRETIAALVAAVADLLPDVDVLPAFVDVQEPEIDDVVAVAASAPVVVPVLLSRGFHTRVDIARAVGSRAGSVQTAPLGPHPLLAEVVRDRIAAAVDVAGGDHIVFAAAGSTDPRAVDDVEAQVALLRTLVSAPVSIGYAAGASPTIADAVAAARAAGATRVIAASYVLAPGFFADVVVRAGADVTTDVLGADERIARVVVERYRAALGAAAG
ncbi:sirohydrochlorin chelatase [Microbacterium telephonicum]|uniref:Sirohydrochlorin ferrochelatase n=1 Tax=Microbacterium telephonicum TaxID=1714841 RepID=A0A498BWG5_9MICO|nr:CbiX/SirB N-terminal domain-containing protein [Microbacterium telephonicum]RLK47339.1 sirohydrochlorin ferrochelatase [Microbacterium telephonicum]